MLYSIDADAIKTAIKAGEPVMLSNANDRAVIYGLSEAQKPSDTVIATLTLGDYTLHVDIAELEYRFSVDNIIDLFPACYDANGDQLDADSVGVTFEYLGNGYLLENELAEISTLEGITMLDSYFFEFCDETLDNYDAVLVVFKARSNAPLSDAIGIVSDELLLIDENSIDAYFNEIIAESVTIGEGMSNYVNFDIDGLKRDYLSGVTWYGCYDYGPLVISY